MKVERLDNLRWKRNGVSVVNADLRFELSDFNTTGLLNRHPVSILPGSLSELRRANNNLFKRNTRSSLQWLDIDVNSSINAEDEACEFSVQDEVSSRE